MNNSDHNQPDVIIVGAGVTGASLAVMLKLNGINCALVEAEPPHKVQDNSDQVIGQNIDPRALAITHASKNILQAIGVWDEIPAERIGCFRKMHVWDENGTGEVNFDSADLCESVMGYIVEQKVVETALESVLNNSNSIICYRPARAKSVETRGDKIYLGLDDGRQLSASLLVAADGQSSTIRRLAGINFKTKDYHQHALACVVETELPHQQIACQKFLSHGPLAFLPMAKDNQCGIVWSTTPAQAAELKAMDEKIFNKTLADAFSYHAGEIIKTGPRVTFPLARAQAENYCHPRLALVGDAAHRIHPLAGQGANLGLLDIACLAQVLIQATSKGRDIGALSVLRKYERWRKGENSSMMMTMEGFKYLFENKTATVSWLRNVGMDMFDSLQPVKLGVMKQAMGLAGDLPDIARRIY